MRALVLAQGTGERWTRPDGSMPFNAPKHLIEIEGETVLSRVCRQLLAAGVQPMVVGPSEYLPLLPDGAVLEVLDNPHPTGTNMDKLFATEKRWSVVGRTTILWGDCYYTDEAMATILACTAADPHWFRRPGKSVITGHRWDETFAFSFLPEHHDEILHLARKVNDSIRHDRIHMWNLYALYCGVSMSDIGAVYNTPHQTHIDDFTDDFDSWAEYCGWTGRFLKGKTNVDVCIPFFDSGCTWRKRSFEWTKSYWDSLGVNVYVGEGESRSAARNNAVAQSSAEVIYIPDADMYVADHQLWAAAALALKTGSFVGSYTDYYRQPPDAAPWQSTGAFRSERPFPGGGVTVSRQCWDTVGGYDERFQGWGAEDWAFHHACETLCGPAERIAGYAYHIYHPNALQAEGKGDNQKLYDRYAVAAGARRDRHGHQLNDPDSGAMLAILKEAGGPLDGSK